MISDRNGKSPVVISVLGEFGSDSRCVVGCILRGLELTAAFIPDFTFGAHDVKKVVAHPRICLVEGCQYFLPPRD